VKTVWIVIAVLVVTALAGFAVWSIGASRSLDASIDELDTRHRIRSVPTDYPRREASNDAARALDEVARRAGLTILPTTEAEALTEAKGWGEVRSMAGFYLTEVLNGRVEFAPPAPEDVARFLGQHAADLDEAESLILEGGDVRFASKLDEGLAAPVPNLLGVLGLTRIFSLRALEAGRVGEHESAWRSLEAAWRLQGSLEDQPHLITRLISIASVKLIAGSARRLTAPVPPWFGELAGHDPREQLMEGLRAEMYAISTIRTKFRPEDFAMSGDDDGFGLVRRPFARPMLFWDTAFALEDMARLVELGQQTDPCVLDAETLATDSVTKRPWWARLAIVMPNVASAVTRANQAALDIEGTRAILDIRHDPSAFTERPSGVCRGESWRAETAAGDAVRVWFTGSIPAPKSQPDGSVLPTELNVSLR